MSSGDEEIVADDKTTYSQPNANLINTSSLLSSTAYNISFIRWSFLNTLKRIWCNLNPENLARVVSSLFLLKTGFSVLGANHGPTRIALAKSLYMPLYSCNNMLPILDLLTPQVTAACKQLISKLKLDFLYYLLLNKVTHRTTSSGLPYLLNKV